MTMLWIAFVLGASAFAHCLGMCGPFTLHLSGGAGRWALLGRQVLWQAGKLTSYVFLGALAGGLGNVILQAAATPWVQKALAWSAGGVMIAAGLVLLGLGPWARPGPAGEGGGLVAAVLGRFMGPPGFAGALVLGLAAGLLPCPIVMMGLAMAVQGGSVPVGMAVMASMGAGTVWSLLVLGLTGRALAISLRRWAAPLAGAIMVLMGTVTVLRGTEGFHHILGCPSPPAATRPCCSGH